MELVHNDYIAKPSLLGFKPQNVFQAPYYFLFSYTKMLCFKSTALETELSQCLSLNRCYFHANSFLSFHSPRRGVGRTGEGGSRQIPSPRVQCPC